LNVEERMSAEMGVEGSSVLDGTSPSAHMFRARGVRKLGKWRRQVRGGWGWTAANGMRDRYRFKETEFDQASCPSFHITPSAKIRFWLLTWRYGYCFCQRSGLLFQLLDASERVIVVRK